MKHNYDFKFNHSTPSNEAIERHMDFAQLLSDFKNAESEQKKNKIRPMVWFARAAGIALVIGAFSFYFFKNNTESFELKQKAYFAALDYVAPPIPDLQEASVEVKLNAEKGGQIKSASGSKYKIDPKALQKADGTPVSGEVTIKYREMHDYVDFFLAGIPMTYDSAGTTYQLESAGMVEIYAEQNGEKLTINPEKPIRVELISELPLKKSEIVPKFNIYKLDKENRNWVYEDVDNLQVVKREGFEKGKENQSIRKLESRERSEIASIENSLPEPAAPIKPERANGNDFVFNMDFQGNAVLSSDAVSPSESARLMEKYSDAMWQVKPGTGVAADDLKKNWEDAKIKPLSNVDFELLLIKDGEELKVTVNPVLTGEEYQAALEDYQVLLAEYSEQLEMRNKELRVKVSNVKDKFSGLRADLLTGTNVEEDDKSYPATVINRFSVTDFGIWNCDRPYLPKGGKIAGSFADNQNNLYDNHTAFLANKSRNTVIRYYATEGTKVNVNEKSENLLWIVTEDQKFAVFRPEDFEKLKKESADDKTFRMDLIEKSVASEKDIRDILDF